MNFTATLELHGKTATGIGVPEKVVLALGSSKRPAVVVTLNGFSYRTTVAPYGGQYLLPVNADVRSSAGVSAGDVLDVGIELDTEPRAIEVPADLSKALKTNKEAKAFFESLSFSNQRGYVDWITSAKKDETRSDRVAKSVESLAAGRKTH
jgi:hypothetical protein